MDTDVIVVGAGPAGSAVARLCAAAGLDTVIVDRATFPRDKPCGGLLSARAAAGVARVFGLGPAPDPALGVARTGVAMHFHRAGRGARWADYRYLAADAGRPLGYVTRRTILDARLLDLTVGSGARFFGGTEVVAWGQDEDKVRVTVRDVAAAPATAGPVLLRTMRARYLVGADGAASVVARGVVAAGRRHPGPRAETLSLFLPLDSAEVTRLSAGNLAFHLGLLRGGYGWAFPAAGGLALGVGEMTRSGRLGQTSRSGLRATFDDLLAFYGLGLDSPGLSRPRRWWVPLGGRRRAWQEGRVMLVGDAAGVADPITGEGLGPAIRSAEVAAGAIIRRLTGRVEASGETEAMAAAVGVGAVADEDARFMGRLMGDGGAGGLVGRLLASAALGRVSAGGQGRLFRHAVLRLLRDSMTGGPGSLRTPVGPSKLPGD